MDFSPQQIPVSEDFSLFASGVRVSVEYLRLVEHPAVGVELRMDLFSEVDHER